MSDEPTHTPRQIVGPDGRTRVVYVRSKQIAEEIEQQRLGIFNGIVPWDGPPLAENLDHKNLVIQAPQTDALRVIRAHLDRHKGNYKFLTGTEILREYFFDNQSHRGGFPQFEQIYIMFGYIEVTNKLLHQITVELFFMRSFHQRHVWLLLPHTLEDIATLWGPAFLNLKQFPTLQLADPNNDTPQPVSVAAPAAFVTPKAARTHEVPDQGTASDTGPTGTLSDLITSDPRFQKRRKFRK